MPVYNPAMTEPIYNPSMSPGAPPDSPYSGYPGFVPVEPARKKGAGKLLKFGVPITAVVAVAVVAFILLFARSSPKAIVSKALAGMVSEAGARLDNTPLKAIGLIGETLKDGKLTLNFNYEDNWNEQEVSGSVKISSIAKDKECALEADLSIYSQPVNAEVYVNKERIAVGSRLLDNNYYGITYSTFREDFRSFGELIGLDDNTMSDVADAIDILSDAMNAEKVDYSSLDAYAELVTEFFKNIEPTSERAELEIGGVSVRCQKIGFMVTDKQIIKLFNDLYDLLESDDQLREQFDSMYDNPLMGSMSGGFSYRSMLRDIRNAIGEFENIFTGNIIYSFYVGSKDRLLKMEAETNIEVFGENTQLRMTFDFGASPQDRWTFEISVQEVGDRSSGKMVWDYKERSNSIENSLTFTSSDDDPFTLKSVWSPESGIFTLSYEDKWGDDNNISGVFTTDGAGFHLSIDNPMPEYLDSVLTIELIGEPGAEIKQIDYVNIDQWGMSLLNKLQSLITGLTYSF
jgi:hypothetical protein